ncbi:hypothetical protein [Microcystis phage Mae-JY30]
MSIIATALRMSAVRALAADGVTIAGARVYDSAIIPIDELISQTPLPFIVISTEGDDATPGGRDLNNGAREIELVVEYAMSTTVPLPDGDGIEVVVRNTDAALELSLGILSRQISACLFGRGGGAWGDAFRALCGTIKEVVSRRGVQSKEGAKFAARQTIYTLRAFSEPPFGRPVEDGTALAAFLAAAEADEGTATLAGILRRAIEGTPVGWPEVYDVAGMIAGYTEDEGRRIGITPLADGEVAALSEATIVPDGWVANDGTVSAQLPEELDP